METFRDTSHLFEVRLAASGPSIAHLLRLSRRTIQLQFDTIVGRSPRLGSRMPKVHRRPHSIHAREPELYQSFKGESMQDEGRWVQQHEKFGQSRERAGATASSQQREVYQASGSRISILPRRRTAFPRAAPVNLSNDESSTRTVTPVKSEVTQIKQEPETPPFYAGRPYSRRRPELPSIWRKNPWAKQLYGRTLPKPKRPREGRIRWNDTFRLGLKLIKQEFASDWSGRETAQLFSDTFATELVDMGVRLPVAYGRLSWQYSHYLNGVGVQASWDRVAAADLTTVVALRRRIRAAQV